MSNQRKLKKQWANQITEKPIDWLWRPWFARGVVAVVDGYPGVGKSTLMFDLIARITTGRPFPCGGPDEELGLPLSASESASQGIHKRLAAVEELGLSFSVSDRGEVIANPASRQSRVPGRVVLMPLEDLEDSVIVPRLKSAGGEMANVAIMGEVVELGADGDDEMLQLPRDLDLLAAECAETRPELIVIDPFIAAMGVDEKGRYVKANDDQSVRRLTGKLKKLAQKFNVAIVLLRHLNKASGGEAVKRGSGSIAIAAQARSLMLVGDDPSEPGNQVLAMVKTNLDAKPPSLSFHIERDPPGAIKWLGASDLSADNLLRPFDSKTIPPAVKSAMEFLRWALWDRMTCSWPELIELAAKEEICERTLRKARDELKLVKKHIGNHQYTWQLSRELVAELAGRM